MAKVQRYFCDETGEPLQLCFGRHTLLVEGVTATLDGVPLLQKPSTGEYFLPNRTRDVLEYYAEDARSKGHREMTLRPTAAHNARYAYAQKFDFKYSSIDYEYIPGLTRPSDEGFLTPVFFNLCVLNKYNQNPDYTLDLFSETYGTIWEGDEWNIAFGINAAKRVIMWLGDLSGLPDEELYYLRSENVDSDHDIHSEFYDAQIEVVFSEPSAQNKLLHLRRQLNELMTNLFGFPAYVLEGEVDSVIKNLTRPVFWEDKHVGPVIESFNRILVESLNNSGFKADLRQSCPGVELKGLKSLKLFQAWLAARLRMTDADVVMCPFFVLYDLRILTCHLQSADDRQSQLEAVNTRLGLDDSNTNLETIYDNLMSQLGDSTASVIKNMEPNKAIDSDKK